LRLSNFKVTLKWLEAKKAEGGGMSKQELNAKSLINANALMKMQERRLRLTDQETARVVAGGRALLLVTLGAHGTVNFMKMALVCAGLLALLINGSLNLTADENGGLNPTAAMPFAILSPADKEKFLTARTKALDENPDLKAEGEDLKRQGELQGTAATQEEKQAFSQKITAHQQKLRAIMVQDDPTLQSIFDQFDKKLGEMRAEVRKKLAEIRAQHENSDGGAAVPAGGTGTGNPGQ
jgi:hypothetical protein